jgi:hypothetical protein
LFVCFFFHSFLLEIPSTSRIPPPRLLTTCTLTLKKR